MRDWFGDIVGQIESGFLGELRRQIEDEGLLSGSGRWVLAVSGGPDSMAMLCGIVSLGLEGLRYVHVAHLNHQLRGGESEGDAEFVWGQADRLGLECTVGSVDVMGLAEQWGESVETAARRARYEFLGRVAREQQCDAVAVGHNADDNVETILQRIVRGTGVRGLAGIGPQRVLDIGDGGGTVRVVRPLLGIRRAAIEDYLRAERIQWRVDRSNLENDYTRNRIRNELLPLLREQYNAGVDDALLRLGRTAEGLAGALGKEAAGILQKVMLRRGEGCVVLDAAAMGQLAEVQQAEVVQLALDELGVPRRRIGFRQVVAVLELVAGCGTEQVRQLPYGVRVRRDGGEVVLERGGGIGSGNKEGYCVQGDVEVALHGVTEALGAMMWYDGGDGKVRELEGVNAAVLERDQVDVEAFRKAKGAGEEMLDADTVVGVLRLRCWRDGDRFAGLGGTGSKTLGDFLTDAKVPNGVRGRLALLADDEGVVWVMGLRIANRVKVTTGTDRAVHIKVMDL